MQEMCVTVTKINTGVPRCSNLSCDIRWPYVINLITVRICNLQMPAEAKSILSKILQRSPLNSLFSRFFFDESIIVGFPITCFNRGVQA